MGENMKLSDKVIIAKVVRTATLRGFDIYGDFHSFYMDQITAEPKVMFMSHGLSYSYSLYSIIFSPPFAKALWGDKFINPEYRDDTGSKVVSFKQTAWKHHLRQMVISDDPVKYLGDNI
jgi:hypothetical protein